MSKDECFFLQGMVFQHGICTAAEAGATPFCRVPSEPISTRRLEARQSVTSALLRFLCLVLVCALLFHYLTEKALFPAADYTIPAAFSLLALLTLSGPVA